MFCGNCLRDNSLVAELRRQGHEVLMVPLYLPLTLDEPDQSAGVPIFFSGVNVFLEQKSAMFRAAPAWLHRLLASPKVLKWAAGKAGTTQAAVLAEITLSMLRGEFGHQARELEDLIAWLKTQSKPDVICLSNALLLGMARRLKAELGAPVVCSLQGEEYFLDSLPSPLRESCWELLVERADELDLFIAPSKYFAELMSRRLGLRPGQVKVVHNGVQPWPVPPPRTKSAGDQTGPSIGFFARMCLEKGLDTLVDAFIELRGRGKVANVRLKVGGSCGPTEEALVSRLKDRLRQHQLESAAEFHPNPTLEGKREILRSIDVFSVPATYGEAFGLYLIEALAAGVPVVQPDTAAFPELIAATGGGLLCEPGAASSLADQLELLLQNPAMARGLGAAGQAAVREKFSLAAMTAGILEAYRSVSGQPVPTQTLQ